VGAHIHSDRLAYIHTHTWGDAHTCMHTYMQAYIHTGRYPGRHTCMPYIHNGIHTCRHTGRTNAEWQAYIHTYMHTGIHTYSQSYTYIHAADRHRSRQADMHAYMPTDSLRRPHTNIRTYTSAYRLTDRETYITYRQTYRQTYIHTPTHTYIHTHVHTYIQADRRAGIIRDREAYIHTD